MRHRTIIRLGLTAATVVATVLPLGLFAGPAFADYAPSGKDVVGVGSDTLQYMFDFLADGDAYGTTGYNVLGNKYKLVSFDATADANARLAYGVDGGQAAQLVCTPGTGSTAGTGNATGTNTGIPCVLNPTIVLRAGLQPVQRPNGSGAGFKALVQDIVAGDNASTAANGNKPEVINFSRASSTQSTTAGLPGSEGIDQLSLATDPLPMIETTTPVSHAVPLSAAQLALIYAANTGSCLTWNDPRIGGGSADAIIPIIPQVGSGTRSYFLGQIGLGAPGTCAVVAEENDPTALAQQGANAADAIEPISQGRLDVYKGVNNTGVSGGIGGYFLDPSCAYLSGAAGCGSGTVSAGTWVTTSVTPAVQPITGTPGGSVGGALFDPSRTLYMYFRSTDVASTTPWQPGTSQNWLNALFYNPSGVGGPPYIQQGAGQALLEDAGVTPLATEVCTNITTSTAC
ncbi:MAG: substrate-binding domain-containing protein [Acidimicrobiales bacterium]